LSTWIITRIKIVSPVKSRSNMTDLMNEERSACDSPSCMWVSLKCVEPTLSVLYTANTNAEIARHAPNTCHTIRYK
jgi:hypothetical protein